MFKRFGLVLFVLAGVVPAIPAAAADNAVVMVPRESVLVDGFNKGDAKTALADLRHGGFNHRRLPAARMARPDGVRRLVARIHRQ